MAFSYDLSKVRSSKSPSNLMQHDRQRAKMFLMKRSPESGENLYDHLSELLEKILDERPKNVVDVFEEYSWRLKEERLGENSGLKDFYYPPVQCKNAELLIGLFQRARGNAGLIKAERNLPDLLELLYYLEQFDIGLPRSDAVLLNLSIAQLAKEQPISNIRFWGKILGRSKNYYVVEAELNEEELFRRVQALEELEHQQMTEAKNNRMDQVQRTENNAANGEDHEAKKNDKFNPSLPSIRKNSWKPPSILLAEQIGTGLNKMVYFVCNSPGLDKWIELPSVMPRQIVAARQIVRCFTGCLEAQLNTYPEFPGNEGNYLRAQIARISATTLVSPIGYYRFESEFDEDKEEIEGKPEIADGPIVLNEDYDPVPVRALINPSMSHWCHHSPYILEQGRAAGWNPSENDEIEAELEEEEDDDDEEEKEEVEDTSKKEAPPLLAPLSQDTVLLHSMPAWTARLSSEFYSEKAIALIRSNVWPGAIAFARDKKIGNVYIGYGLKYEIYTFKLPLKNGTLHETNSETVYSSDSETEEKNYQKSLSSLTEDSLEIGELSQESISDSNDDYMGN